MTDCEPRANIGEPKDSRALEDQDSQRDDADGRFSHVTAASRQPNEFLHPPYVSGDSGFRRWHHEPESRCTCAHLNAARRQPTAHRKRRASHEDKTTRQQARTTHSYAVRPEQSTMPVQLTSAPINNFRIAHPRSAEFLKFANSHPLA